MLTVSFLAAIASAAVSEESLKGCARLWQDDAARLACYDRLVPKYQPGQAPSTPQKWPKGRWSTDFGKSEMDDSPRVTISLAANSAISAWPGKTEIPVIVVRCQENKTELFVRTGARPDVEHGNVNGASVRVRIDSAQPRTINTSLSTDGEALFFPGAIGLLKQWADKQKMTFQFTPYNSNPQSTTFDIAGLNGALEPLRKACNW